MPMSQNDTKRDKELTDEQEQMALALACGIGVKAVAKSFSVSARTVYRAIRNDLRPRIAEIRAEMVSQASGRLTKEFNASLGKLLKLRNTKGLAPQTLLATIRLHWEILSE